MKDNILAYALVLNGKDKFEVELQYKLLLQMLENPLLDQDFDENEFELLVEEIAGNQPISINYAKKLLIQTNCFMFDGIRWKYNEELCIGETEVTQEDLIQLFKKKKVSQVRNSQMDNEKMAIIEGIKWCIYMVQLARQDDMMGLPAFLKCGEKDSLIGKNVAGTATSDALSLLCNGKDYIIECNIAPDILASSFDFLVEQILGCQCTLNGWDNGGFFPLEDQPEAEHPTVDATCLAIMALCDFYTNRVILEEKLNLKITTENIVIENAILAGLNFLFRMQQPEGSYGIYKYKQEYPDGISLNYDCITGIAMPNENCTRIVLSAMGVCKGSGVFDVQEKYELYGKCSEYISKAYAYIKNHMAVGQGYLIWAPYFGDSAKNYSVADVIISAARVCRSFIPVWRQCEEEREQIRRFYSDFFGFWKQKDKNIGKKGKYVFKTPGKDKYSVGTYQWESYPKMIAAFTVLQGYNLFGMSLNKEDWKFLEEVVSDVLQMQHPHGHWNSPSDSKKPFCAATLAAIELLKEYRTAKGLK